MRVAWLPLVTILGLTAGCSADAVTAPEPTLTTGGTFFALPEAPDEWRLYRTLGVLSAEPNYVLLFVIVYQPIAASAEEATELAKDPDLKVQYNVDFFGADPDDVQVVWFRTLNPEEQEVLL